MMSLICILLNQVFGYDKSWVKLHSMDDTTTDHDLKIAQHNFVGDTGYYFTDEGEFLDKSGNKFEYAVHPIQTKNQERYEDVGEAVTDHIYKVMENDFNLERVPIPRESKDEKTSFVFMSEGFIESPRRKLVLINGSGAVKAGQWARSIIINDNLMSGSMLPYIEWANKNEYDILVLNTNECDSDYPGSTNPIEHAQTVWNDILSHVSDSSVFIVAHSFGGVVVQRLARMNEQFNNVIGKIAFTDSVHFGGIDTEADCINWVSSREPVNANLDYGSSSSCSVRSAGTTKHPWTSHFAMDSIFEWFCESTP